MRESKVEDYFDSQVRLSGGDVRKVQWIGRNGAPDKLAGWPNGNSGFVELKRPRGTAEVHQSREHTAMRAMGLRVDIVTTLEEVDEYVRRMK